MGLIEVAAFPGEQTRVVRSFGGAWVAGVISNSLQAFSAAQGFWLFFGVATLATISPRRKAAFVSPRSRALAIRTCTCLNTLSPATALVYSDNFGGKEIIS